MAGLFEKQILEESSEGHLQTDSQQKEWRERFKRALFLVMYQYYEDSAQQEMHRISLTSTLYTLLSRVLMLFQLLGLLLVVQTDKATWTQFRWVLQALASSRCDHLAADLHNYAVFFYATAGVVFSACALFLLMLVRAAADQPPSRFFAKHVFAGLMVYLRGFGLIPTLSALIAALKYSVVVGGEANEYLETSRALLDMGVVGVAAGGLGLAGCTLVLLHVLLVYEQSQARSKWNLRAKAHALVDFLVYAALFAIVSLLYSDFSRKAMSILVTIPAALGSGLSLYYLPYYRLWQNVIWPAILNVFILAAIVTGLESTQQQPTASVAILLFVSPVVVILTKEAVRMRWEYICWQYSADFSRLKSHFQVELGTRKWVELILSGEKHYQDEVCRAYNAGTRMFDNKMMCVWETNFHFSVTQDLRLAMLKVTKAQFSPSSLEADFRVFCFSQVLEQQHKSYEELRFLTFWHILEESKSLDSRSCHLLASFWSELSSSKPRFHSLTRLAQLISRNLRLCVNKMKSALQNYRNSKQALTLIGTLYKNILNDSRGNEYLMKIPTRETAERGYFCEESAVIVVSGQLSTLGEILYLSDRAKDILAVKDSNELIGANISICIPQPWAKRHSAWIMRFLKYATTNSVNHAILHLCKTTGYLVEVLSQIRVSYLKGNAYILVAFTPRDHTREVVLLGKACEILAHTEAVPTMVGLSAGVYTGLSIEVIFPSMIERLEFEPIGSVFSYRKLGLRKLFRMRIVEEIYAVQKVRCLQILSQEEEAKLVGAHYDSKVQSQMELLQTLTQFELGDVSPHIEKNVGFGSTAELRVAVKRLKTASFADVEDPAITLMKKEDGDVKLSMLASVASTNFLATTHYGKADLRRVKTASFRLKAALLCLVSFTQMLFTIILSGLSCGLLMVAEQQFLDEGLQMLLRRGYFSARIATKVAQMAIDPQDSIKNSLLDDVKSYEAVFAGMKDQAAVWREGPLARFYMENVIPTWEISDGAVSMRERNLFDAIQTYIDHAKQFGSADIPHSADYFYVRRNGLGETFQALRTTTRIHLETNLIDIGNSRQRVEVVIYCGEGVLLILFLAVMTPSIAFISKVQVQGWGRLLSLKRATLLKLRNECHNRLEFHHNKDPSSSHPLDFQNRERRTKSFRYQWIGLAAKSSAYLLLSSAFLLVLWKMLYDPAFDLLSVSPNVVVRLEQQNELLQTVYFWVQEIARRNETEAWPQLHFSAFVALDSEIDQLKASLCSTIAGFSVSLVNPDFQLDAVYDASDTLRLGLHFAISVTSLDPLASGEESLTRLEFDIRDIQAHLQAGTTAYIAEIHSLLGQKVALALIWSAVYVAASLLLYLCFYVPMVNSYRKRVSEVWKLYRIVPKVEIRAGALENVKRPFF